MNASAKRVAILFPSFQGGGAEAVCAWMMEALKYKYEVTVISFTNIDVKSLNQQYGTNLNDEDISAVNPLYRVPVTLSKFINSATSLFTIRQHLLGFLYRNYLSDQFDIAISAFDEMDLGNPGIQYIHFPKFGEGQEKVRYIVGYPESFLRRFYFSLCKWIFGFSQARMLRNMTIANSKWTASVVKKIYPVNPKIIYPPVVNDFTSISWEAKENGFLLVSRIVPEKKIERAIQIISEVRSRGYDVHLHIVGGIGDDKYHYSLIEASRKLDWVVWEQRLHRKDYVRLLSMHRYGIHVRENEQFGLGVAEMVTAGCIPFVPQTGGVVEIIGEDPQLYWTNKKDAVEKIISLLQDQRLQRAVQEQLITRSRLFSTDVFKQEFIFAVEGYLKKL